MNLYSRFEDYSALIIGFTKKRRQCLSCSCSATSFVSVSPVTVNITMLLGSVENDKSGAYMPLVGIVVLHHAPFVFFAP